MRKALVAAVVLVLLAGGSIYLTLRLDREVKKPFPAQGEVELPSPRLKGEVSVEEALARRRSIREYAEEPLTLEELSQLLWAAQGITDPERGFRTAPSAGATYPLEVYVVAGAVEGLAPGVYRYEPHGHKLEARLKGDLRSPLAQASLGQPWVAEAPVNLVVAAIYERTTSRYGERGVRYVHLEAGHVGQNLYLQAVALELGMVVVGAFQDQEVQQVLKLPEDQKPLYVIPVGRPRA